MAKKMTKSEKKFRKSIAFCKLHEDEIRQGYAAFAEDMGCELTAFEPIEEDLFGDGIPRCITVFTNKAN